MPAAIAGVVLPPAWARLACGVQKLETVPSTYMPGCTVSVPRARPAAARQRRQTFTERRMQPLAIRRVAAPLTWRAPPERLDACRRAIDHAACGLDPPPPPVGAGGLGAQGQ